MLHAGPRQLALDVRVGGRTVVTAAPIGLDVAATTGGRRLLDADRPPPVTGSRRRAVRDVIAPAIPKKRSRIPDRFDELRVRLGPTLALTVEEWITSRLL